MGGDRKGSFGIDWRPHIEPRLYWEIQEELGYIRQDTCENKTPSSLKGEFWPGRKSIRNEVVLEQSGGRKKAS